MYIIFVDGKLLNTGFRSRLEADIVVSMLADIYSNFKEVAKLNTVLFRLISNGTIEELIDYLTTVTYRSTTKLNHDIEVEYINII